MPAMHLSYSRPGPLAPAGLAFLAGLSRQSVSQDILTIDRRDRWPAA